MQLGVISGMSTASGFFSGIVCTVNGEERIIAHGATGSIIQYARSNRHEMYKVTEPIVTGHTNSIQSCSWEPNGEFLATTSLDKTTRIFAPRLDGNWNEIARPQIHGYDMQAISVLDSNHFLSAGDEKILRSFEAPKSFSIRLNCMNGAVLEENEPAEAVVVPALGLSNKMGGSEDEKVVLPDMSLDKSPSEYDLCKHTLWIETDKLYGHGLEVYSLAVSCTGQLAASASKSTTAVDAAIRFWSRNPNNTWTPLSSINVHSLTVVRMKFSPNNRHLLSVSRDRHFSIIDLQAQPICVQYQEAHSRIIWCADWSHDGSFFVTGSRDRTLKTWNHTNGLWTESSRIQFESPVTAVALHSSNLMAVGLEDGSLVFYRITNDTWTLEVMLNNAHSAPITDLQWRPQFDQLAVISNTVQIMKVSRCVGQ
jgi:WD40 repeat protein